MHPIWFLKWAWEKAWSEDGLFTLIEHNQGFLSLAALGVALWAFIVETKRANSARQETLEGEIARRANAEAAERREREFALQLSEREQLSARQAEVRVEVRAVWRYKSACGRSAGRLRSFLAKVQKHPGELKYHTAEPARREVEALGEILRAAPLDADVILASKALISCCDRLIGVSGLGMEAETIGQVASDTRTALNKACRDLYDACNDLVSEITHVPVDEA